MQGFSRQSSVVIALVLVVVLLIPALAMTFSSSIVAVSDRAVGHRAQTASVDPNSLTLTASPMQGYVGYNITFYANGSSYDSGANLTFTIFYDYYLPDFSINPESPVTVNNTTSPGFVIQKHAYNQLGNFTDTVGTYYWVALIVDDGQPSDPVLTQVYVSIYVPPVNTPPWMVYLFVPAATYGEPVTMQALVQDNQSLDTVTMVWDFGDGTNATNVSAAYPSVLFTQIHTWRPPIIGEGNYNATVNMNLSLTDGLHPSVNYTRVVGIQIPFYLSPTVQLIPPSSAIEDKPVVFTANASAQFGDPLTWTFNYSDGQVDVFHTDRTAPNERVWQNATHVFDTPGNYTVSLSVSDAPILYQVGEHNMTVSFPLTVKANSPPTIFSIDTSPGAPRINESIGYVNVTFKVQAYDADGDVITLTWDFGGGDIRTNVSSGGTGVVTYIQVVKFAETGNFTILLNGTDGIPGHTVEVIGYANITSDNHAPVLVLFDKGQTILRDSAMPNETVNITIILTDREHDPLDVTLDFGDKSPLMVWKNLTDYDVNGNITLLVSHAYVSKGQYTAVLVVTDNKIGRYNHTQTFILPIKVDVPRVIVHYGWDWWDYASLGMLLMIPILAIAWTLENRRHRRQIEDQGMSYDEWKLIKEIKQKGLDK
jgi:hypothetical protein